MTPSIAILGAGPSGLMLAKLLQQANIDFVVFERDESANKTNGQGGTLDVHSGSGQLALQEAGLFDQFKLLSRWNLQNVLADMDGAIHARLGGTGEGDRPEIDRKDLRAMLLNSVLVDKIHWGLRVQHVQKDADGSMSVHFTNGSMESGFRLVVGADGAWSKARSLVTSAKPQYSGMHYLTSTVAPENPFHFSVALLVGQGVYLACGGGRQLTAQKLSNGTYSIGVGLKLPEDWASKNSTLLEDPVAMRQALLRDYFGNCAQAHTDLIKHSEGAFRAWPLYSMPAESLSWETIPGITLVGDAAHVTTPFAGEGVNCAMHDSLQLAQQIVKYGLDDLDRAVLEYEKLMFPRAVELIRDSTETGKFLFSTDAPQGWKKALMGDDG